MALDRFGILLMGIYRMRDLMVGGQTNTCESDRKVYKRCVLGHPERDLQLDPSDILYGLVPFYDENHVFTN